MEDIKSTDEPILVADIGGTNARFALALARGANKPQLLDIEQVATHDFASLQDAARDYLQKRKNRRPSRAVMAVASAVTGDAIKITNNPWSFSIAALARDLDLKLEIINDFTAMAQVLPVLGEDDLQRIGDTQPLARDGAVTRCYAVVGPGTGLGVGGVMLQDGRSMVIQSEGGHISFAPNSPYEIELLRVLLPRFGRVSAERLISGTGLVNLHEAVRVVDGLPVQTLTPEQISAQAADDASSSAARTLDVFAELLGSFAGDVALAFGAWDGVFLPGGVTQKLLPWIQKGGFRKRFDDKGRHSAILKKIPTQVITHPQAGLLGTAVRACS